MGIGESGYRGSEGMSAHMEQSNIRSLFRKLAAWETGPQDPSKPRVSPDQAIKFFEELKRLVPNHKVGKYTGFEFQNGGVLTKDGLMVDRSQQPSVKSILLYTDRQKIRNKYGL